VQDGGMKKTFFTGLVSLLPFAVTILLALWVVNILTKPFMGIVTPLLSDLPVSETLIRRVSQLAILLTLFFFILILGIIARWFFFHTLLKCADQILLKIPILNKIYKTTKDVIQALFTSDSRSFQQVVMTPFPCPGSYIIGLVVCDAPDMDSAESMVSIFLPTAPNPSTGFLIMRPKSDLIYLAMQSSDALKYIVSCGVVPPESVKVS
jgi:uncharacterized membrane protein